MRGDRSFKMAARVHLGAVPIGRRTVPYRSVVHEPTNGGHPWSLAHFAVSQTISLSLSLSLFLFFFSFSLYDVDWRGTKQKGTGLKNGDVAGDVDGGADRIGVGGGGSGGGERGMGGGGRRRRLRRIGVATSPKRKRQKPAMARAAPRPPPELRMAILLFAISGNFFEMKRQEKKTHGFYWNFLFYRLWLGGSFFFFFFFAHFCFCCCC